MSTMVCRRRVTLRLAIGQGVLVSALLRRGPEQRDAAAAATGHVRSVSRSTSRASARVAASSSSRPHPEDSNPAETRQVDLETDDEGHYHAPTGCSPSSYITRLPIGSLPVPSDFASGSFSPILNALSGNGNFGNSPGGYTPYTRGRHKDDDDVSLSGVIDVEADTSGHRNPGHRRSPEEHVTVGTSSGVGAQPRGESRSAAAFSTGRAEDTGAQFVEDADVEGNRGQAAGAAWPYRPFDVDVHEHASGIQQVMARQCMRHPGRVFCALVAALCVPAVAQHGHEWVGAARGDIAALSGGAGEEEWVTLSSTAAPPSTSSSSHYAYRKAIPTTAPPSAPNYEYEYRKPAPPTAVESVGDMMRRSRMEGMDPSLANAAGGYSSTKGASEFHSEANSVPPMAGAPIAPGSVSTATEIGGLSAQGPPSGQPGTVVQNAGGVSIPPPPPGAPTPVAVQEGASADASASPVPAQPSTIAQPDASAQAGGAGAYGVSSSSSRPTIMNVTTSTSQTTTPEERMNPFVAGTDQCFALVSLPEKAPAVWERLQRDFMQNYFSFYCSESDLRAHMGESWFDRPSGIYDKHDHLVAKPSASVVSPRRNASADASGVPLQQSSSSQSTLKREALSNSSSKLNHVLFRKDGDTSAQKAKRLENKIEAREDLAFQDFLDLYLQMWQSSLVNVESFCQRFGVGINEETANLRFLAFRARAATDVVHMETENYHHAKRVRDAFARAEGLVQSKNEEARDESAITLQKNAAHWAMETRDALIAVRGAQARVAAIHRECLQREQNGFDNIFGGIVQEEAPATKDFVGTFDAPSLELEGSGCPQLSWFLPESHQWLETSTEIALTQFLQSQVEQRFLQYGSDVPTAYIGEYLGTRQTMEYHAQTDDGAWEDYAAPKTVAPKSSAPTTTVAPKKSSRSEFLYGKTAPTSVTASPGTTAASRGTETTSPQEALAASTSRSPTAPPTTSLIKHASARTTGEKVVLEHDARRVSAMDEESSTPMVAVLPLDWSVRDPSREVAFKWKSKSDDLDAYSYLPWLVAEARTKEAAEPPIVPGYSSSSSRGAPLPPVLGNALLRNPYRRECLHKWSYVPPNLVPEPLSRHPNIKGEEMPALSQPGFDVAGVTNLVMRTKRPTQENADS
ncbi:unnamed protein product [Amoebophrya sp. A25]|nr:unnamed protein product [Amoebophrya sp. A25]|eukprot:GSA25T00015591001.1